MTPLLPTQALDRFESTRIDTAVLCSLILQCNTVADRFGFARALSFARALFPYDRFACSVIDTSRYRAQHSFNLNFSDQCLHDLDECGGQGSLLEEWCRVRQPLWVGRGSHSPRYRRISDVLVKHELGGLAVHGLHNVAGSRASVFFFARASDPDDTEDLHVLRLLVPALHLGFSNLLFHGKARDGNRVSGPSVSVASVASTLTPREAEVAKWLALGKTNEEIALILDRSTFTVKNHVQRILVKLHASNRTQAATHMISTANN